MIISGYDYWKRKGLSRRRKLESVGAETTSSGSPFQIRAPETLQVRLPTVDSRNIGTTRRLELAERSARRPCRSATRLSGPRYRAPCRAEPYVSTAILYWMRSGTRSQCRLTYRASAMWSESLIDETESFLCVCIVFVDNVFSVDEVDTCWKINMLESVGGVGETLKLYLRPNLRNALDCHMGGAKK